MQSLEQQACTWPEHCPAARASPRLLYSTGKSFIRGKGTHQSSESLCNPPTSWHHRWHLTTRCLHLAVSHVGATTQPTSKTHSVVLEQPHPRA